jgi:hydrogenase expression/formation protein HypE
MSTAPAVAADQHVVLAHGGGGELTQQLLSRHILPGLANGLLDPLDDGAILKTDSGTQAFTTDAFVVQPLEFPGGDIGRLAVCGTVNDLAVMGADPVALSLALIIEEGLPLATLDRIVASIAEAATEAGVAIATGDTKVIERRAGDGLMITTAGVGTLADDVNLCMARIAPGDRIILTGTLADHGLTIMTVREGIEIDSALRSDAAPLNGLLAALRATGADIKFMRDPTRAGVAGLLADVAQSVSAGIELTEDAIPMTPVARHTAELLGLDPLNVANEGKCVIVVSPTDADAVLRACRAHPLGHNAAIIGEVVPADLPLVTLRTRIGGSRVVQRPYGEELPRIC